MNDLIKEEFILESPHGQRPFLTDIRYPEKGENLPLVIFVHGFKGYKDWGAFNLAADAFAREGFAYAKLNFSRNGTTIEKPREFADLEAFGNNNFEIELDDLKTCIDYFYESEGKRFPINTDKIYLIGHSRGGSTVLLKAAEDSRIKKVVTWAAMSDLTYRYTEEAIEYWRNEGVNWIWNGRTHQNMPVYFQMYENYALNPDRYNVALAASKLKIPLLAFHGTEDPTLPLSMLDDLKKAKPDAETVALEGADHVFGASEPYPSEKMPPDFQKTVEHSIAFLKD